MYTLYYDLKTNKYIVCDDNVSLVRCYSFSCDNISTLIYFLSEHRYDYIYCWDARKLFCDIDNWMLRHNIPDYSQITKDSAKLSRVTEECISRRDGEQNYYTRRYWLKTYNKLTSDRHKRLHGVTLINASNYFGGMDIETIFNTFQCDSLSDVLIHFNECINRLTGLNIFNEDYKPCFLTLGAISKAYYLYLKYPALAPRNRLKQYQKDYPINKDIEIELRLSNLLSGGIIYLKDTDTHYNLFKYDKVSLFPSVERKLPQLGTPELVQLSDTLTEDARYEYIYIFKTLVLKRKADMPALYPPIEGYKGKNSDYVILENEALFKPLYIAYLRYYDVVDSEINKIYRCRKLKDNAIVQYVDRLFNEKNIATDPGYYYVIKLLLNNLHGKFSQNPVQPIYTYKLINNCLCRASEEITDKWEITRFDYLRGAYIYSMARTKMLNDLWLIANLEKDIALSKGLTYRLVDHLLYSDTDSAILDHQMNPQLVGKNLGFFKFESHIIKFKVFAPKIYAYIDENEIVLKCAGAKSQEIINYYYQSNDNYDLIEFLENIETLPITIIKRTSTGAQYITEWRPLSRYGEFKEQEL